MITVHHLLSDAEWYFDDACTPEHALAFVYCEDKGLLSWYFNHSPDFRPAHLMLPFTYGSYSVGLGDYAVMIPISIHDKEN